MLLNKGLALGDVAAKGLWFLIEVQNSFFFMPMQKVSLITHIFSTNRLQLVSASQHRAVRRVLTLSRPH